VIVLSLVVLTALMMLGAALYRFATAADREMSGREDDRRAFYLAEAGVAEAMVALRAGATGEIASRITPAYLSEGIVWVTATEPDDANRVRLLSTAMAGSGRAAVEVVVENLGMSPLFRAVLNSREELTLNAGVLVDSFDSELGTYASQAVNDWFGQPYADIEGHVYSNMDIILNADAVVLGDAQPGPEHTVFFNTGAHVEGSTDPAEEEFAFPPIPVPPVTSAGPYTLGNFGTDTLGPGLVGFDDFTLNKGSHLTVQGPATLVVGHFIGGKDARMTVDTTGGPVTFYVQGDYTHMANFEVQPASGSAAAVAFMVQGTADVVFPASGRIRGAYYVPNASVMFDNNCEAWGSFAANRIEMASAMNFHYDESLAKHWEVDDGTGEDPLVWLAWRSAAPPSDLLADRRDPFALLGLDRTTLPSPAEAWTWAP
jgi:Tfp pilus assembly protein PilX